GNNVQINFVGLTNRTAGLIILLAAAGLSTVVARPRIRREIVGGLGTGWVGLILVLLALHVFGFQTTIVALSVIATFGVMAVVIPVCALIARSSFLGSRLDSALWIYMAA